MKFAPYIIPLFITAFAAAQTAKPLDLPDPSKDAAAAIGSADQTAAPTEPAAKPIEVAPPAKESAAAAVDTLKRNFHVNAGKPSAPITEPASPLDQISPVFRVSKKPIAEALRILGRPHGISFVVTPDARDAVVSADMSDATIRECLMSILEPEGLFYEERAGYITVRRYRTEYYIINYPAIKRTSSGSISVNLSASQNQNTQSGYGGSNTLATTTNANTNGQAQQDQSTLSIEKDMDVDAWKTIEEMIQGQLSKGETLTLNRFTGIATISATDRHHEKLRPFIDLLNRRLNQQVHIQARIVEINLSGQSKFGVDWQQALTVAGNAAVSFDGEATTNLTAAGPNILADPSVGLRIGAGRLGAVITALSQQGNVKTESQPSVTTLVNQTTYIKIGEDRTFFTLSSTTSINTGTTTTNGNVTSLDTYDRYSQTFGNVLEVTPSVSDDGIITLIVSPVISRLKSIETSPDGRQNGPNTDSKATESIIRLRSGETGVMGGFVFTEDVKAQRGVPGLEKIPGIGRIFRTDATTTARTELVIFVTATLDAI